MEHIQSAWGYPGMPPKADPDQRYPARSAAQNAVRWGFVVILGLAAALVVDLARQSLAADRVVWGQLQIDERRQVRPSTLRTTQGLEVNDRPRLVRFTTDWCGPCQSMKSQVFSKKQVAQAIHDRFDAYNVDLTVPGTPQQALGERYAIQYLPTLMITDAQGIEIARLERAVDTEDFLGWLDRGWELWAQGQPPQAPALTHITHKLPVK